MTSPRAAVILAAGRGTRMRSELPKVLHPVGGRPMLDWAIGLAKDSGCDEIVVVYGAHAPEVGARAEQAGIKAALQDPPRGTGHAVQCAQDALAGFDGPLAVLFADTPLVGAETVERAFHAISGDADIAVLGFEPEEPGGYGRLILDEDGALERIVEAKDASPEERAVRLCNSGVMAAQASDMFSLLGEVRDDNAKGEYYLTDIVALGRARGLRAAAVRGDADEFMGVNSRADLAAAEAAFQARMRADAMARGVTLTAPETVFFSFDTAIEADVVVEPNVVFGPGVAIEGGAAIRSFSHLEGARVRAGAQVGPYARLRPGAEIGAGARIGNFVEVKKARFGEGAKANHLAYVGDAEIGAGANLGAGTITCNYDGFGKHRTEIGDGAFVGSNSALVAPVSIGPGAYVGSGSVITRDVPGDALAVARGRQENKEGWAKRFRDRKEGTSK